MDHAEVKRLLEHAKSLRLSHEAEIKDAFLHTFPAREFDREAGTQVNRTKLFDTTAVAAALDLRTTVMRLLVPQSRPWAEIAFRSERLKESLAVQLAEHLNEANSRLFSHFAESNFYLALGEGLLDAIVGGTGCIAFIDGDGPLSYMSVPTSQLYFMDDHRGRVDAVFREHQMTLRQVEGRFGRLGQDYNAEEHPDRKIKLVEACIPDGGKFKYTVTDAGCWQPLVSAVVDHNPFVVWRWDRQVGEVFGEGPIRHALPHIRQLQIMSKSVVVHGEFAALGLWQAQDETINVANLSSRMKPGGLITVDTPLVPVEFPGDFRISEAMIADQRQQVRSLLHANLAIRHDGQNTYMTATEVEARTQKFMEEVGEPARRMQYELLQPLAEQAVARLQARGVLPKLPPELVKSLAPGARDQADIFRVEVNAAITKAMRAQQAQSDLTVWASAVQAFGPEVAAKHVNVDRLARSYFVQAGIGADAMRSESEVAQIEAQQAQQQQVAQLMAVANTPVADTVVKGLIDPTRGIQQAA